MIDTCRIVFAAQHNTRGLRFAVRNHIRPCALNGSAPWPHPPSPSPPIGVTGATIWKIGHEDRRICRSPRGDGSLSALRSGGDRNYADCQFTFADLLLSHTVASRSTFDAAQKDGEFLAPQAWCLSLLHHRGGVDLELSNSFGATRSVFSKLCYAWLSRSSCTHKFVQPIK